MGRRSVSDVSIRDSQALLSCPFCGNEAELRYHPSCMRDPSCRAWEVGCSVCDARVGNTIYATGKTRDEAIAAWNRRADK